MDISSRDLEMREIVFSEQNRSEKSERLLQREVAAVFSVEKFFEIRCNKTRFARKYVPQYILYLCEFEE